MFFDLTFGPFIGTRSAKLPISDHLLQLAEHVLLLRYLIYIYISCHIISFVSCHKRTETNLIIVAIIKGLWA